MQLIYCIIEMEQVFKALAASSRRKMLDRLHIKQGVTLSELVEGLDMRRQSATRHIAVLEQAELIVTLWQGREKLHYLNPVPLEEISRRWLDKFSQNKAAAIISLKQALEENNNE